ncbi:MAG: methyltransferase domain-containing protein, partial [Muribaculaceae bacterium]|nr:methyltransferase domain-containing protein [Muribaculaceae bacterium]
EIGAGQGLLTETWRRILHPLKTTFVDLLPMPQFGVSENDEYVVADAEEWLRNSSAKYDVILSASTIQWFADPVGFIRTVKGHLNPGGFAVISTFSKGNLHELDSIRPCPLIYHTAEEYKDVTGIEVEEWDRTLTFSSPREMLMHLRHTGVSPRRSTSSKPLTALPTELTYRPLILIIGASPIH